LKPLRGCPASKTHAIFVSISTRVRKRPTLIWLRPLRAHGEKEHDLLRWIYPKSPQANMIRTRFAPSPTGYLHIGGVRSALFNWLLARQSGGQFILRIDDTDQQRNVNEAIAPILNGFRWLGLDWDEGPEVGGPHEPYFQSQRSAQHQAAAAKLVQSGFAYRDYSRPEELQALREQAERDKKQFVYDRQWMAEDDAQAAKFEAEGRTAVIRLKMPREGECVIQDLVRGEVRVQWSSEPDHVVQRADGSCLYHLASVVDDHDLNITHVVRAEEHLPNTPRQIFILESLGYPRPVYAHLPYVAEPGGTAKLSKRKLKQYAKNQDFAALLKHGERIAERAKLTRNEDTFNPVIIDFYREIGFLPEAILNYLLMVGWSLDGEREKFTVPEMIDAFTLERVTKSPASFDPQKLTSFQADRMAQLPVETKTALAMPFVRSAGWLEGNSESKVAEVVAAAGERIKVAGDILDFDYCFVTADKVVYDEKAFQKRITKAEGAAERLSAFADTLDKIEPFDVTQTELGLKRFCEEQSIEIGQIIHALRVATTGVAAGFGMFESLAILGREEVRKRIHRTVALAKP
jgi:glutamyl-tRNA synthetase